jgi:hypothetical protein
MTNVPTKTFTVNDDLVARINHGSGQKFVLSFWDSEGVSRALPEGWQVIDKYEDPPVPLESINNGRSFQIIFERSYEICTSAAKDRKVIARFTFN